MNMVELFVFDLTNSNDSSGLLFDCSERRVKEMTFLTEISC